MTTIYNFYFKDYENKDKSKRLKSLRKVYYLLCQCFDMHIYEIYKTVYKFIEFISTRNIIVCTIYDNNILTACAIVEIKYNETQSVNIAYILFIGTNINYRRQQISKTLITNLKELLSRMNTNQIRARVHRTNEINLKTFIGLGFVPVEHTEEFIHFIKELT